MLKAEIKSLLSPEDQATLAHIETGSVDAAVEYAREVERLAPLSEIGWTLRDVVIVKLAEALKRSVDARGADLTELERRIENERAARLEAEQLVRTLKAHADERASLIFAYMKHVIEAEGVSFLEHERADLNLTIAQRSTLKELEILVNNSNRVEDVDVE